MTGDALLDALSRRGAILDGHFRLSSGRHSQRFVQKFRILEDPVLVANVAADIVAGVRSFAPTVVVSAAVGGIVLGYECARQLGTFALFVEKEHGVPTLRRGFELAADDRVLVVEDVVTTGLSVREIFDVVRDNGAHIVAAGVIVRRSLVDFGVPTVALLDLPIESFAAEDCPQCAAGIPLAEPGSRFLG
ncbi:MAG: orotate phosphoribosyltransferase [Candidatus Velthaea sp.]|jgi:orotate phosphoribosyltransferase